MSDRITIDHMLNNIVIKVKSVSLSSLDNHSILEWIKTFIQTIEDSQLQSELAGDSNSIRTDTDTDTSI